jgi:hypothetical protein
MCTVSFVPRKNGYAVGMNRDEHRSRALAWPPRYSERNGLSAIYPSEPSGGTWIGVNNSGLLFAVLNWYSVDAHALAPKQRSRGEVIPQLIFAPDARAAEMGLTTARLQGTHPFRLIGIDPQERTIYEWRWNGSKIGKSKFPWTRRHWFSSSLSDARAEEYRNATCIAAAGGADPEGPEWLAELHRSHRPFSGPYSICVHRPDAATVSYTEVLLDSQRLSMRYIAGAPCGSAGFHHVLDFATVLGSMPAIWLDS